VEQNGEAGPQSILVIDVGGAHVKAKCSTADGRRKAASGPGLTADMMVSAVKAMTQDWAYDAVTIGCPTVVMHGKIALEPTNLGPGWVGYDFAGAFDRPVKIINDAAMQALGSYEGGVMLFLGLGTGLGSALVVNGVVQPLELGPMPFRHGRTCEDYVGSRGLARLGKKRWRVVVADLVEQFAAALLPDYIVIGGGNARRLAALPPKCRLGDNALAFAGGFRLWSGEQFSEPAQTVGPKPVGPGAAAPPGDQPWLPNGA